MGAWFRLRNQIQNGDVVEIHNLGKFPPVTRLVELHRHVASTQSACATGWPSSSELNRSRLDASCSRKKRHDFNFPPKKLFGDNDKEMKRVASEYGYGRVDDLLAAIGYGKLVPRNVIAKYLGARTV